MRYTFLYFFLIFNVIFFPFCSIFAQNLAFLRCFVRRFWGILICLFENSLSAFSIKADASLLNKHGRQKKLKTAISESTETFGGCIRRFEPIWESFSTITLTLTKTLNSQFSTLHKSFTLGRLQASLVFSCLITIFNFQLFNAALHANGISFRVPPCSSAANPNAARRVPTY